MSEQNIRIDSVVSADGTVIGYHVLGSGPGLVIVHGGMASSESMMGLARKMAGEYTVYVPDRRGRGMSGPFGNGYGIQKEVDDLDAILSKTGASYIFGLSSGALISLQAALLLPAIWKAALYEPPLSTDSTLKTKIAPFMLRYDREVAEGDLAAAFVTVMKGLEIAPGFLALMPRFLLVRFFRAALRKDKQRSSGDHVPLSALIPTQHYDYALVVETDGTLEKFMGLRPEILLLGGSHSPRFLKNSMDSLGRVVPHVRRVEFPGLGHTAPVESGEKLEIIASELRRFFR